MDGQRFVPCPLCGAQHACSESVATRYAGRRVTRWCESCRRLFDVEFPRRTTLGDLLFAQPIRPPAPERAWGALVWAIAAGNAQALYTLYDRLHRIIFTLMVRMTHDRAMAEELTFTVFANVWRRAWSYDPERGSVIGWILNEARSTAIGRLRFERPDTHPTDGWANAPMDGLPPPTPTLWNRLARHIGGERGSVMSPMPEPAAWPDWHEAGPGISYKVLAREVARAHVSLLVRLAPGVAYPPHTHAGREELYLLDGELWIESKKLHPGDYNRADAGSSDQRVWSETGCTCALLTSTEDLLHLSSSP